MKTLLQGGPLDGTIRDIPRRNEFAFDEITQIWDTKTNELIKVEIVRYNKAYKSVKHSCKKKGTVQVFKHDPDCSSITNFRK